MWEGQQRSALRSVSVTSVPHLLNDDDAGERRRGLGGDRQRDVKGEQSDFMLHCGGPSWGSMRSAIESQAPNLDHAREGVGQSALGWVGVERPGGVMETWGVGCSSKASTESGPMCV